MILYNSENIIHDLRPFCLPFLSQQCYDVYFISLAVVTQNETWLPNITEIPPLTLLASSTPAMSFTGEFFSYVTPIGGIFDIIGEWEGKFLKKEKNDLTTGRPAVTFKVGDECSFKTWHCAKILPFPEITGTTIRNMYFHRTSKIR